VSRNPTGDGWFRSVSREFKPKLLEYAGLPITYVEIGVWRGASASWVCDQVLTHEKSKGVGIDPYLKFPENRDIATKVMQRYHNWSWRFDDSKKVLRHDWNEPIDVLYVDGLHYSNCVVQDFVLAWPYMRRSGLVIFDDYWVGQKKGFPHVPEGVAAILLAFDGLVEIVRPNRRQYAMRIKHKTNNRRWGRSLSSGYSKDVAMNTIRALEKRET
jgi:predicted O-methyltransferase YrrM